MSTSLLRNSAMRSTLRASAPSATKRAAIASTTFTRGKATLPDLPCKLHCQCAGTRDPALAQETTFIPVTDKHRRLRRAGASHQRPNHGAAPQQAPQHLRELLQHRLREDGRSAISRRHPDTNRNAATDQLPRRRARQPQLVLGEPGAQVERRRRAPLGRSWICDR